METQILFSKSNLAKQRPFRGEASPENVRRGIMSYRIDSETGGVRETVVHALPPHVNPTPPHPPMIFPTVGDPARIQELKETSHRAEIAPPAHHDSPQKKEKVQIDKWGMVAPYSEPKPPTVDPDRLRHREAKWLSMIADWDRFSHSHPAKVRSRCRKGVPDSLRGVVWARLTGAQKEMESAHNRGVYQDLLTRPVKEEVQIQIRKDVRRIFPNHILFKNTAEQSGANGHEDSEHLSPGHLMLSNILKAFAIRNPQLGYCQSMGTPAATFLMYMPEELSFWMLDCFLMKGDGSTRFGNIYIDGFPLLHQLFFMFDDLFRRILPKLSSHFQANGAEPMLFAVRWFQLIFAEFPREMVLAVLDIFFSEGTKVLLHVALAVLSLREKQLLQFEGNDLMEQLRDLYQAPEFRDAQAVVGLAMRLDITKKDLDRLECEYVAWLDKARRGEVWLARRSMGRGEAKSCEARRSKAMVAKSWQVKGGRPRLLTGGNHGFSVIRE